VLVLSSEIQKKRKAFAQKKDSGDDDVKDEEEDNKDVLHADPQSKGERRGSFFHNVEQQVASLRRQSVSPQLRWQVEFYYNIFICNAYIYACTIHHTQVTIVKGSCNPNITKKTCSSYMLK